MLSFIGKVVFLLRKVLFFYLLLKVLSKLGAFGYLLITHMLALPIPVLFCAGLSIGLALAVVVREYLHKARTKEYAAYLVADSLFSLFNLFYIAASTPLKVTTLETVLTGSILDVVLTIFFLADMAHRRRYVRIREQDDIHSESEETQEQQS